MTFIPFVLSNNRLISTKRREREKGIELTKSNRSFWFLFFLNETKSNNHMSCLTWTWYITIVKWNTVPVSRSFPILFYFFFCHIILSAHNCTHDACASVCSNGTQADCKNLISHSWSETLFFCCAVFDVIIIFIESKQAQFLSEHSIARQRRQQKKVYARLNKRAIAQMMSVKQKSLLILSCMNM